MSVSLSPPATASERLLLARRRAGTTQAEAAKAHGVSLYEYRRWELGRGTPSTEPLGRLTDAERCLLRRLRAGKSQLQVARALGVSRWWLGQMEDAKAPVDRLAAFWARR